MNPIAIDIETTGLRWDSRVLCISAAWRDEHGEMVSDAINCGLSDLFNQPSRIPEVRAWLQPLIVGRDWLVFHNGSFDLPFLMRMGVLSYDQCKGRVFDTLIMARCTDRHNHGVSLEALVQQYGLFRADADWYAKMKGLRRKLNTCNPEEVLRYARVDTEHTLLLFEKIAPMAAAIYEDSWIRREGDFALLIGKMRFNGIHLDLPHIQQLTATARIELVDINRELVTLGIMGATDDTRLMLLIKEQGLADKLGLTEKGKKSLDETSLLGLPGVQQYEDLSKKLKEDGVLDSRAYLEFGKLRGMRHVQACHLMLAGRDINKRVSTFLQGFREQADAAGRIHPLWGAGGTVSFRLNCTEPNAQAVPKKLAVFAPPQGRAQAELDLQQAELRLMAGYAVVNSMAEIFARGEDIHDATAILMGGVSRTVAKRANFGAAYAAGVNALMEQLHISANTAREVLNRHRKTFPQVPVVSRHAEERWLQRGFIVAHTGKRLYATEEDLAKRSYKAFNQLIQMGIAEIMKLAMLDIDASLPEALLCGQIHDSTVLEVDDDGHAEEVFEEARLMMMQAAPAAIMNRTKPPIIMEVDATVKRYDGVSDGEILDIPAEDRWWYGSVEVEEL